jgi:hypothetical protein
MMPALLNIGRVDIFELPATAHHGPHLAVLVCVRLCLLDEFENRWKSTQVFLNKILSFRNGNFEAPR